MGVIVVLTPSSGQGCVGTLQKPDNQATPQAPKKDDQDLNS